MIRQLKEFDRSCGSVHRCISFQCIQVAYSVRLLDAVEMVDCETNEPSIKPFTVPRNWRGQLDVEAIEKSLAASQHILEGIVHGNRHGYPACRDGWTCTSYTGTPIQIQVAPKPGKWLQYAMCIVCRGAFLEPLCLSFLCYGWHS